MAPDADPYRTLGLTRGATLAEVKRAYRRLAKANHPDAAGEAALPRFLAIQAAYDQIAGPGASGGPPGRSGPGRPPWGADPDRADATRRAYGGRARRTRAGGPRRPGGGTGSTGPGTSAPPRPERPSRPPNKATLGSTSYDGAEGEPFEPDWGGASWYGTTSGTYWTLNPKEYADPRKHGPEYQARARRAAAAAAADGAAPESVLRDPEPDAGASPADAHPPTHTTSSWWDATAGPSADPSDAAAPGSDEPTEAAGAPSGNEEAETAPKSGSMAWLDGAGAGLAGRVARAVVGWIPIGLAVGWVGGEATGCGRFAATCDPAQVTLVWIVQIAVLAILLVAPRVASVAAIAAVAALVVAIPAVVVLSTPGPDGASGGATTALVALAAVAWAIGLAAGVIRATRPGRRPVS